jgi:PAS domain S-box-containing protein
MYKVKTPRDTKKVRDLRTHLKTTTDIRATQIPVRTVRSIKGTHIIHGIRDINRIGWQAWEAEVAEAIRTVDQRRYNLANRLHFTLERVQTLLKESRAREEQLQATTEEMEAANEELQATAEELEATNEELLSTTEEVRLAGTYNRSLIDANLDPLVTIGRDGKITDLNAATEKVTGCSRDELIGTDFSDYFSEPEKARAGYQQAFRKDLVRDYALELKHRDGRLIPVLYNASVYRNEAGAVLGVVASAHDVTKLKKAEEQLRIASTYNRSLIEGNLDPLVTIDADGKITDVNAATEAITGYSRKELIGTDFSDYFSEPQKARAGHQQAFQEGLVRDYALRLRHRDGHTTPVLYNASVYRDEAGEVLGVLAAARDVTQLKEIEAALDDQREELVRSNSELLQFAYVASHDLQEPLRMVSSYLQLIERRYKGKLDSEGDEFIAYAVDGANRMQQLINALLDYSRIQSQVQEFVATDCEAVFDRVLGNLQMAIEESGAVVTHDPLPTVMGDASQLTQVFQNLLSNALKFHGAEPPQIHVSAATSKIQSPKSNIEAEWVFSVRDNGVGIAPEYFARIFQIFQRLHGKEQYAGTGIGLTIVKKIVERHNGRIWVESESGKGATFYFTIPVTE